MNKVPGTSEQELRELLTPYFPSAPYIPDEEIEHLKLELSAYFEAERKQMESYLTEMWSCPGCNFPENFLPDCALCGYPNEDAKPEREK